MMFYYKVHESHGGYLLAACDKSVCGKTLKEKDLNFFVNPRFYKDKQATKAEITKLFKYSTSANLIGKNIVKLAMDAGFIDKENIIKIAEIPHAQFIVVNF